MIGGAPIFESSQLANGLRVICCKDLLADLNIFASTGKVTQRPKQKTALPRVKTSAQEPKERKAAEPKVIFKKVDESNDGQRLDNFLLSQLKGVPKSLIYRV